MTTYLIFVKANDNPYIRHWAQQRRKQKAIEVVGHDAMMAKVDELKKAGATIYEIRTAMGNWVKF